MDPRIGEALQQAHDLVAEMIKQTANEPSMGLYFIQQHVHKVVPSIVSLKAQVLDGVQQAELSAEDARDALAAVKVMKDVGPPLIDKMIKQLSSSVQTLHPSRRTPEQNSYFSVSDSAYDATKKPVRQSSALKAESPAKTAAESTNYARNIWDSALDRASSLTRRSSAVDIQKPSALSETSAASEVPVTTTSSPYGYVRSVFESASQRVGSFGWSDSAVLKQEEDGGDSGKCSSSSSILEAVQNTPGRYVRAVLDTALMRRKETEAEVVIKIKESEVFQDSAGLKLDSVESYDKFQAANAAKLAEWLNEP